MAKRRRKTLRVLAIDGGGVRGIIPAMVLADLEQRTGRPIAEQFDMVAGASTGGIIALLLTVPGRDGRPRYSAREVVDIYASHLTEMFSSSPAYQRRWAKRQDIPKFPATGVSRALKRYFGDARVRDTLTGVLVTSYDIRTREDVYFGRFTATAPRVRDTPVQDLLLRDLARATSAFPGLFPPVRVRFGRPPTTFDLIDGGVMSANPAAIALAAMTRYQRGGREADILLVSLGTGDAARPIPFARARTWGFAQWAQPLVDVLFDASNHVVDSVLSGLEPADDYYRFQVDIPAAVGGTDDVRPATIAALQAIARAALAGRGSAWCGGRTWPAMLGAIARDLAGASI